MIVQELDSGNVEVAAIDPVASMQAVGNNGREGIATDIQAKLKKIIERL